MERRVVAALADEGVEADARDRRGPDFTGVWVGDRKIASIGVHVARGVTTHGFAVNVDNDLQPFEWIVACGLEGVRMTSVCQRDRAPAPGILPCFREPRRPRFARRRSAAAPADRVRPSELGDRAGTLVGDDRAAPALDPLPRQPRRHGRARGPGPDVRPFRERKPPWFKVPRARRARATAS